MYNFIFGPKEREICLLGVGVGVEGKNSFTTMADNYNIEYDVIVLKSTKTKPND